MAKNRVDSTHIATEIMRSALEKVAPPLPLTEEEVFFWDKIIAARHTWTEIDKILAVNLARCLCQYEEEQAALKAEGSVLENARGTQVMNPRHAVIEQLSRRSVALTGKLHVHAAATMGEVKNSRKKNAKKHEASELLYSMDDDDLIARPH